MDDLPLQPVEQWYEARAQALLGLDVHLARRSVVTRAGNRRGILVYGYQVLRAAGKGGPPEVLGLSPPEGAPLDLSELGTPEAAVEDAVHRREAGVGPYPNEVPGRIPSIRRDGDRTRRPGRTAAGTRSPRPTGELTTSTLSLPVA